MADDDIVKRAARMLREGATLKAEPCPYCGGVRVMRGGEALCVGCGSEPDEGRLDAAGAPAPAAMPAQASTQGAGAGAGPAVAALEKRLAEAAASVPSSRGQERHSLLDEIASIASAIKSLEAGRP